MINRFISGSSALFMHHHLGRYRTRIVHETCNLTLT